MNDTDRAETMAHPETPTVIEVDTANGITIDIRPGAQSVKVVIR